MPLQSTDVMLQGFAWDSYTTSKWTNISNQSDEIASYFDLLWLPPSGKHGGVDWSENAMGYLPMFYFNQNSSFGTQAELISLISTLKNKGVKTIADIVINHRVGQTNWINFPSETYNNITYSWGLETICNNDKITDCNASCATGYIEEPTGNNDTGISYNSARDIDHTNTNVQNTIKAYLDFMKNDIGYSGWRYDLVKGYSGEYTKMYNNSANGYISVGECYDFSYDVVLNWIIQTNYTSMAFDFPLKNQLNKVFNQGAAYSELSWLNGTTPQACGLIHNENRRYAVTFVDNHDTGRTDGGDGSCPLTGNVLAAYAYILSHPGIPCVWWNHWNNPSYKSTIQNMINARKEVKIHSESEVTVNQTNATSYVATINGQNGSILVKLGTSSYSIPANYTLIASGTNFEMWKKSFSVDNKKTPIKNTALIYPNPTKDIVNIVCKEEPEKIEIKNSIGYTVKSTTDNAELISINISNLSSGIYFVHVFYKNGNTFTKKIIKD